MCLVLKSLVQEGMQQFEKVRDFLKDLNWFSWSRKWLRKKDIILVYYCTESRNVMLEGLVVQLTNVSNKWKLEKIEIQ